MREFVFDLQFEPGVDPVMDVFIEHPDLVDTALSVAVSTAGYWRVDRISGPEPALDALETVLLDPAICADCIGVHDTCDARWTNEVLAREPNCRTVYMAITDVEFCHSVPFMAQSLLGDGLCFDTQRRGATTEWRILAPRGFDIGELFEALRGDLPDGVTLTLRQLGTPSTWGPTNATIADVPAEQREALLTAYRMGYYETPRSATTDEIATEVGIPTSTLRYRLRRAESWVVGQFVDENAIFDVGAVVEQVVRSAEHS